MGSNKVMDILSNNYRPIAIPMNLSMIVKPKYYVVNKYGGYLTSDVVFIEYYLQVKLFKNRIHVYNK